MAGPQGPIGQQGSRGEKGDKGDPGDDSAYRPRYWVSCSAAIDLISLSSAGQFQRSADGVPETSFDYTVLLYSNSDVEVDCGAGLGSSQSGSIGRYYPAAVHGARTGSCQAASDYPPAATEVGYWEFTTAAGPQTKYVDVDNPLGLNGFVYSFTENDCSSEVLEDDGTWKQVTLADVF